MKPIDDFDSWYRGTLGPDLDQLEARRQGALRRLIQHGVAGVVIVLVIVFALQQTHLVALLAFCIVAGLGVRFYFRETDTMRRDYKDLVIRKLLGRIDPMLRYEPDAALKESSLIESHLFTEDYNYFTGEDLVFGEIHGTDFGVCEVHLQRNTRYRDGEGNSKTRLSTVFRGFFFEIGLTHPAEARVVVMPRMKETRVLGFKLPDFAALRHDPEVTLDDPAFERRFQVFSESREAALEALQPELRQHLVRLAGKQRRLMLSLVGDKAYLALRHNQNMFEPLLTQPLHNPEQLKGYMAALKLITSIPSRLSLTRDGGVA